MSKNTKPKLSLSMQPSSQEGDMSIEEYNRPMKTKQKQKRLYQYSIKPSILPKIDYHIETLKRITEFREKNPAPVDADGCRHLHDQHQPITVQKFQILMSLLLSVQTKDEITGAAIRALKQQQILTPQIISQKNVEDIQPIIRRVNFHKKKAINMIKIAKIFLSKGPPQTFQELMNYPGVGVKIATLYFNHAQGKNQGIGVDTHVHRISNRLGWCNTNKPQDTEKILSGLFPQKLWLNVNYALVGFGQTICHAKKPLCESCPVNDRCQYYMRKE